MLDSLAPFEKAALFVVSLGRYIGPEVLARLEPGEMELLRMGLNGLHRAPPTAIEYLHRDFYQSYMSADSLRLPVFAYLRGFLTAHSGARAADRIIDDIAVDNSSMSEPLSIEHDRKFLFDFICELEETRDRIFPPGLGTEWALNKTARVSPLLRPAARAVHRQPGVATNILRCWLSGRETFRPAGREDALTGASRLALFLRTLSPETAALMVKDADRRTIRDIAFEILCAEDLAPLLRQSVLIDATEVLLNHGLIPRRRVLRAREISRLLRCPAWFCDLLRDMAAGGTISPEDLSFSTHFPTDVTMRRELARACSHAVRRRPAEVYDLLTMQFCY